MEVKTSVENQLECLGIGIDKNAFIINDDTFEIRIPGEYARLVARAFHLPDEVLSHVDRDFGNIPIEPRVQNMIDQLDEVREQARIEKEKQKRKSGPSR